MRALAVQQRFFPSLRIGLTATATTARREGLQVHCRQGDWDGACGLHCSAMALTLLGRLNGVANLSSRRSGIGAALWRAGLQNYFDGVGGADLAKLIQSLDPSLLVQWRSGIHRKLLKLTQIQLETGRLVIVGWRSRNERFDHWVLAVGMEGLQDRRRFRTSAILCLDPSGPEPVLCGYNGRLELTDNPPSYGGLFIRYLSNQGDVIPVSLTEIVVIGEEA